MRRISNIPNIADDAESVAAFFGDVCAARGATLTQNAPIVNANGTGTQWEELCGACEVTCFQICVHHMQQLQMCFLVYTHPLCVAAMIIQAASKLQRGITKRNKGGCGSHSISFVD